jgi:hypothetical protein
MQWLQDPDNDVYHKAVEMTKKVTFAFYIFAVHGVKYEAGDFTCVQKLFVVTASAELRWSLDKLWICAQSL